MPKLFFGNIPHASSEMDIQQWVESRGFLVEFVEIIYDRVTGKPRGFGFVTLADKSTNLQAAIAVLNGRRMEGRILTVNEATPLFTRPEHHHAPEQHAYEKTRSMQDPT